MQPRFFIDCIVLKHLIDVFGYSYSPGKGYKDFGRSGPVGCDLSGWLNGNVHTDESSRLGFRSAGLAGIAPTHQSEP